ncbi:MAG: hypothetical protein K9K86_00140 [Pseudomonadales bacterium]|nr:hypothetical protein [Pseudomonadales bacterium]
MRYFTTLMLSLMLLTSCASTISVDSDTLYRYQIDEEATNKSKLKKIVIASVNYAQESPSYLRYEESRVDNIIAEYLQTNGYEVITGNQFDTAWANAIDQYGEYYDRTTATYRRDRFNQILSDSLAELKEKYDVDGILFTDLIVRKVNFSYKQPHYAAWDGVKRKPRLKGGNGVPRDYNWAKTFRASSLSLTLFRHDKKFLFNSIGGIEVIDNLNMKTGTPKATRNTNLFGDEDMLLEGIQLAFHPLIPMPNYPGKK